MTPVRQLDTRCEMTQIVLPPHTNNHGTLFGGQLVAWIDICASVSARRFARGPVVTASIDQLHFLQPVRLGMVVVLQSMVNMSWRSSMEVGVRIDAEDPEQGTRIHCCSAYTTFVSLDDNGKPTALSRLLVDGPELERRAREAQERKDNRLEMRERRRRDA